MCVVSMVMDHYREKWEPRVPQPTWEPYQPYDFTNPPFAGLGQYQQQPGISQEEIAEFRKLLERAREYDKRMNQPDCELEDKRQAILTIAKQLGVEISFL